MEVDEDYHQKHSTNQGCSGLLHMDCYSSLNLKCKSDFLFFSPSVSLQLGALNIEHNNILYIILSGLKDLHNNVFSFSYKKEQFDSLCRLIFVS